MVHHQQSKLEFIKNFLRHSEAADRLKNYKVVLLYMFQFIYYSSQIIYIAQTIFEASF